MRSNQGWSTEGIQFPKINMNKFESKDPNTWIFQMEKFFYVHQVPNLQNVTIASLYLDPQQYVWYLLSLQNFAALSGFSVSPGGVLFWQRGRKCGRSAKLGGKRG